MGRRTGNRITDQCLLNSTLASVYAVRVHCGHSRVRVVLINQAAGTSVSYSKVIK